MNASLYLPVFTITLAAMCMMTCVPMLGSTGYHIQEKGNPYFSLPLAVATVIALWLGNRPAFGGFFGDSANYAIEYINLEPSTTSIDWHSEWIWQWLMKTCKALGLSYSAFFTIVELGYFLTMVYALKVFVPKNVMLGLLFSMSGLMFFTFGVNGLRNGLACHIVLLGMAYLFDGKFPLTALLYALAFGIHRSSILPMAASVIAVFVKMDVKAAIYMWIASIPLSLLFGNIFTALMSGLGFDDRMTAYTSGEYNEFASSRFRIDFLTYSAMPVLMAWFVCVKRRISDNWYNALTVTYCICNAFWVMVIRSSFSNRFAYLSWFMYPLMLCYPLIMMPVWEDQDQKTAIILMLMLGFTVFMNILWGNL